MLLFFTRPGMAILLKSLLSLCRYSIFSRSITRPVTSVKLSFEPPQSTWKW